MHYLRQRLWVPDKRMKLAPAEQWVTVAELVDIPDCELHSLKCSRASLSFAALALDFLISALAPCRCLRACGWLPATWPSPKEPEYRPPPARCCRRAAHCEGGQEPPADPPGAGTQRRVPAKPAGGERLCGGLPGAVREGSRAYFCAAVVHFPAAARRPFEAAACVGL